MAENGENMFRSLGVYIWNLGMISDPNFYKLYLDRVKRRIIIRCKFFPFSLTENPPRDLQTTAYK